MSSKHWPLVLVIVLSLVAAFPVAAGSGSAPAGQVGHFAPIGGGCTPGTWSAGPDFPSNVVRAEGAFFPGTGKFYALGGRRSDNAGDEIVNPYEYDPVANTWTMKAAVFADDHVNNMVGGVLTMGGTAYIFAVGGSRVSDNTASALMRYYDPVGDTIGDLTGTDPWPYPANDTLPGGAAVYNNKLYVFGGFIINTGMLDTIWEFDPDAAAGSRWTQMTSVMGMQLGYVPVATVGNHIYTGGGSMWDGTTLHDTNVGYDFDPVADTIASIATLPSVTAETKGLTMLDGTFWVLGGGRDAPNPSSVVQVYDPGTNSWTAPTAFTIPRRNFPADVDPATGAIYLAGGYGPMASMEIFTPEPGCGVGTPTPTLEPPTATPTSVPSNVQVANLQGQSTGGDNSGLWLLAATILGLLGVAALVRRQAKA